MVASGELTLQPNGRPRLEVAAGPGEPPEAGWAQLHPPPGEPRFALNFEFEPHYEPPVWPSEPGKQEIMEHLDIWVQDLDEAVSWAVQAGATEAGDQPQDAVRVMLDPAGHPFCLFTG
jgi:hypothetical protein